jgi:transcription initiation factor TFIID subunit 10
LRLVELSGLGPFGVLSFFHWLLGAILFVGSIRSFSFSFYFLTHSLTHSLIMATSSISAVGTTTSTSSGNGNSTVVAKAEISSFLDKLDSYQSTIPAEVTAFHLNKSGCIIADTRITKLVSLAADKFLAEILYETKQTILLKNKNKRVLEEANTTLTMDALCTTLKKKKISVDSTRLKLDENLLLPVVKETKKE